MRSEETLQRIINCSKDDEYTRMVRGNANNISKWFPKIKDCGIPVPKTFIFQLPQTVMQCCYEMSEEAIELLQYWIMKYVHPVLKENNMHNIAVFVKNGTFSDKFDFRHCASSGISAELALSIFNINYAAELVGAGGQSEIAIRERLGMFERAPKIYNGMKLLPEFRIFYDFATHTFLYAVNYWDWHYCHEEISKDVTDGIVYESYYPTLRKLYNNKVNEVISLCENYLKDVNMSEIYHGPWSVDIMYIEGKYWLTDMAVAQSSAYWDLEKAMSCGYKKE